MATMTHTTKGHKAKAVNPRFILLNMDKGWKKRLGSDRAVECKRDTEIVGVLKSASNDSLWISSSSQMTDALLRAITLSVSTVNDAGHRWGSLLTLESPQPNAVPFLRTLFQNLVGESASFKWLPIDQLGEVLAGDSAAARDVFIGGVIDTGFGLVTLVRGNFERITAPLSIFRPSGTSKPDFTRFELDDFGHSVRFGEYEASAHFILFDADADYRKRTKKRQRAEESGFGASLRRLRILKGVPQSGFAGISAKTIGRIEGGLVEKPHGTTLKTISQKLGVSAEEIESY